MPRARRSVFEATVRQQTVEQYQRSFRNFEWDECFCRPGTGVKDFKLHAVVLRSSPARLQSGSMSARKCPETAVIDGCIFEGEPKSGDVDWFGVQKSAVLVTGDLAADVGLFEDVHRLQQVRVLETDCRGECFQFCTA